MSDRRNCPSCGVDNSQEARYCRHCGVRLPKITPNNRPASYTPGPADCPYCRQRIWLRPTTLPRTAYIANAKYINTSPYLGTNSSNMIRIEAISSFRQLGPRNNQEDWLMPETPTSTDRVLVLCDGMGGHGHGEVASQTVAEAVYGYLHSLNTAEYTAADIQAAVDCASTALCQRNVVDSERTMGTTLVVAVFNKMRLLGRPRWRQPGLPLWQRRPHQISYPRPLACGRGRRGRYTDRRRGF